MSQAIRWRVLGDMPIAVPVASDGYCYHHGLRCSEAWLRDSEKEAIDAARKLRIAAMDRLQKIVNALDQRYDAIEDAEKGAQQ